MWAAGFRIVLLLIPVLIEWFKERNNDKKKAQTYLKELRKERGERVKIILDRNEEALSKNAETKLRMLEYLMRVRGKSKPDST